MREEKALVLVGLGNAGADLGGRTGVHDVPGTTAPSGTGMARGRFATRSERRSGQE